MVQSSLDGITKSFNCCLWCFRIVQPRDIVLSHLDGAVGLVWSAVVHHAHRLVGVSYSSLFLAKRLVLEKLANQVDADWDFNEVEANKPSKGTKTDHHVAIKDAIAITPVSVVVIASTVRFSVRTES